MKINQTIVFIGLIVSTAAFAELEANISDSLQLHHQPLRQPLGQKNENGEIIKSNLEKIYGNYAFIRKIRICIQAGGEECFELKRSLEADFGNCTEACGLKESSSGSCIQKDYQTLRTDGRLMTPVTAKCEVLFSKSRNLKIDLNSISDDCRSAIVGCSTNKLKIKIEEIELENKELIKLNVKLRDANKLAITEQQKKTIEDCPKCTAPGQQKINGEAATGITSP